MNQNKSNERSGDSYVYDGSFRSSSCRCNHECVIKTNQMKVEVRVMVMMVLFVAVLVGAIMNV